MLRSAVMVVIALALAAPLFAGDIVSMPTGNTVQPGKVELNAIWWNLPPTSGPADNVMVGELFVGIIDRVELDLLYADVKDDVVFGPGIDVIDNYFEANLYVTLLKEDATHPSLIVGATNVFGSDWIGGGVYGAVEEEGVGSAHAGRVLLGGNPDYDEPSLFLLTSYNLAAPAQITWNTPLIRAHLGYGNKYHDSEFFGGVQFKINPAFGGAILNYKSNPAYMATFAPAPWLELTAGTIGGDTFYRAGGFLGW